MDIMRRASRAHIAAAAAVVVALAAPAVLRANAAPAPGAGPNLSGVWRLDRDASNGPGMNPEGEEGGRGGGGRRGHGGMPPGGGGMGGPGGGGMGGRGGMGGGGMMGGPQGGGGERPSEEEMKHRREMMRELMTPPAALTITQNSDTIVFTFSDGRTQRYATDGKKEKHQLDSGTIETKTQWKEGQLVKEIDAGNGVKIVETYVLKTEDGRSLEVHVSMEGGRRSWGGGPGGGASGPAPPAPPPIVRVYLPDEGTGPGL